MLINKISYHFIITLCICVLMICVIHSVNAKAVALTSDNFDSLATTHDLVFLNFYADWCRFSQILGPIFDETSDKIASEFPNSKILFGKIDSVSETYLAQRFKISKYPTLKLLRNNKLLKREYRGQRSQEALTDFIRDLMKDPIKELSTDSDVHKIDENKRKTMIYLQDKSSPIYQVFLKVALDLRDDCHFYFIKKESGTEASIVFVPSKVMTPNSYEKYPGELLSYDELSAWTTNKCIPLVREITFENAEELTEEGLPFLILFHHPDDTESIKLYTKAVQEQLLDDRTLVNFLVADGMKFAHPLHHLGKTQKDLPLIAIDSFRHMYLFPNYNDIHVQGKLKEFVLDLYSGKLHREFHYGPDPVTDENVLGTNPPESSFKKLAPSRNRYTLLRDEL